MKKKPIYVEIHMETDLPAIWNASQDPALHSQWDLRFSSITYLPKENGKPQLFTYQRSVLPFLTVEGWGKSTGSSNNKDGTRSSALHFGTDQWFSPIKEGKGYWKYIPEESGTTFLTQYDYEPNFGKFGRSLDALIFRPIMGWATALSFDVLKRWLERGETPASQYLRFFTYYGLALLFAFVWLYQGIVPKLVALHPKEQSMIGIALHLTEHQAASAVLSVGVLEALFGLLWLLYKRKKHLFALQMIVFPILTSGALLTEPGIAAHPFNPIVLNSTLLAISIIGYFHGRDVPTAASCKRRR